MTDHEDKQNVPESAALPTDILKDGVPYKSRAAATSVLSTKYNRETHQVVEVTGGFAIRPLTDEDRARLELPRHALHAAVLVLECICKRVDGPWVADLAQGHCCCPPGVGVRVVQGLYKGLDGRRSYLFQGHRRQSAHAPIWILKRPD